MSVPDLLMTDPAPDMTPAATTPAVAFESAGETLLGVLHVPAGPGPHPIVVLLHGFPGNERNFDVAQALRRAGYASLVFHYRGSWGIGGSYSWAHLLEDATRVTTAVREPEFAAAHRLDPERLAVAGHSAGGFTALMTAAADPSIAAVASVSGFDFGWAAADSRADPARRAWYLDLWRGGLAPLRGTSAEALLAEMEEAGDSWSLAGLAPRLANRPVLLIGTGRDDVTPAPFHHDPVVSAYRAHPVDRLEDHLFPADHDLSDHRVRLSRTLADFLRRHLPPSPGGVGG
ncbi:alpha/beta fold hydrolase [Actinoallomurus sp. NPDC052308]|uniref:alpha/beta hydrolase family protein n=1 Tax=Actinoallomurus sp. NPDC052308 TaxID=3155530 RepID=UPI003430EDCD